MKWKRKILIIIRINILQLQNLTTENFAAELAQANLITKTDFNNKIMSLKRKVNWNKTYHVLFKNDFKNYEHLIQVIFLGEANFEENIDQNYLVFQPISEISKVLLVFVVVNILVFRNLKVCLMKRLVPLIIVLLKLLW